MIAADRGDARPGRIILPGNRGDYINTPGCGDHEGLPARTKHTKTYEFLRDLRVRREAPFVVGVQSDGAPGCRSGE